MPEQNCEEAKKEIRSLLLTYPRGVTLEEFRKTYRDLLGQRLPSRTLGFRSDVEFLQSMPDVVNVYTDACGKVQLTGIADEKSQHIQKLVSKQRTTKPNNKSSNNRQPVRRPNPATIFHVREQTPFLPGPLRAEILETMADLKNGISLSAFTLSYRKRFNKVLPLVKGLATLEGMIKLIPQLEIREESKEKKIYHRSLGSDEPQVPERNEINSSTSPISDNAVLQDKNSFNLHKSGIPDDVLEDFQQILQKCSDGILDVHFPPLYENITGKPFDLHQLGYNSMLDLVDALPHVFKRILNPDDNKNWVILPAKASVKHCLRADSSINSQRKQFSPKSGGIPADASSPVLQYIPATLPEDLDLSKYVPVFVSAINNPSLFWFQLQTDEAITKFDLLEKDMGRFYDSYSSHYKMNSGDVAIGSTCVILCPDDHQWYRAVIKAIPSNDRINVSYVDYGGRENIPQDNLFYVRSKYHEYPACAFEAKLAGVKPPENASTWNYQALARFTNLCSTGILMANLKSVNKGTYSVYLCDTNGEADIHLSDVLVNEGLAEFSSGNQLDISSNCSENNGRDIVDCREICSEVKIDLSSELSPMSDPDILQSDRADSFSESENLPVSRQLLFSPKQMQYNDVTPNISPGGIGQRSKRYVKMLQLCKETKMHFINLENRLYMPCADISKLLWDDKDSDFLIERLKYKEVEVPFLSLSKDNHTELFSQCIWYKIPEFETLIYHNSSLIVCSLEWALNILNIFGHPSLCLRLAIQDEIRKFDPFDSIWKEFCYEEPYELSDMEEEIEQKISKLCLYDLRAKNEAFKIKRLKLLRSENNPASEEVKMVELHQKVIGRRMREIETLCSQYSSCP